MFGIAFVTSIIIARSLGPDGKGQLTLLTTFTGILSLITGLGVTSATMYYLSHERVQKEQIVGSSIVLQLLLNLVAILLVILLLPIVDRLILKNRLPMSLIFLSLLLLPILTISGTWSAVFLGMQKIGRFNILRMVPGIVHLGILTVLLALTRLNVLTVMVSSGIAAACTAFLGAYWLRVMHFRPKLRPSIKWRKALLGYGVRGWLGTISQQFNYRLDVFIVNIFVGVAGVGQYSLAVTLAESLWYIPDSVSTILMPRTAAYPQAALSFTPRVARNTVFITAVGAVIMALVSYPFMTLVYGNRFAPSVSPFLALLPGIISLSLGKVLANDLAGHGKPESGAWSSTVSLVVTVVLDFLLIPRMGITGAALASTLSYTCSTLVLLYLYVRFSGNSPVSVLFIRSSDLAFYVATLKKLTSRMQRYSATDG